MTTATAIRAVEHTETTRSIRFWTALGLATFILSILLWVGFTTIGGVFFTLSDGVALLMATAMIPVMVGYDRILWPRFGVRSTISRWIGVVGMVIAAAGSVVLLTGEVSHEFVQGVDGLGMQLIGFGIEGLWFILLAAMAGGFALYDRRLVIATYITGIGFLLGAPGAVLGPESALVITGGAISFIGFTLWAIWSRRVLAEEGP